MEVLFTNRSDEAQCRSKHRESRQRKREREGGQAGGKVGREGEGEGEGGRGGPRQRELCVRRSVKKPYLDSDRFRKGVCRTSAEEEEGDAAAAGGSSEEAKAPRCSSMWRLHATTPSLLERSTTL